MKIKKVEVGSLQTNCYLLLSGPEIGIIDPGGKQRKIKNRMEDLTEGKKLVKFVLSTHYHWDHIQAAAQLVEDLKTDFLLGEKDLQPFQQAEEDPPAPDRLLAEGDRIALGDHSLEVWETPGHSPGSITLLDSSEKNLIVGDLMFASGFGRTDLPGGSQEQLEESLSRVVQLDGNWKVYPGHGPVFDLEEKVGSSPYLSQLKDRNGS